MKPKVKPKIEKIVNKEAIVVTLAGQIELPEVRVLDELLDAEDLERDVVIFDFSQAEYMSSSVLGWLTGFRARLVADNKREPILTGCNCNVHHLFDITGLVSLFQWAD